MANKTFNVQEFITTGVITREGYWSYGERLMFDVTHKLDLQIAKEMRAIAIWGEYDCTEFIQFYSLSTALPCECVTEECSNFSAALDADATRRTARRYVNDLCLCRGMSTEEIAAACLAINKELGW